MANKWIIHGTSTTLVADTGELQAPNASNNAAKMTRSNTEGYVYRLKEAKLEGGEAYVVSLFVKLKDVNKFAMRVGGSLDDNYVEATFNPIQGRVVDGPKSKGDDVASYGANIQAIGDEWVHCSIQIGFFVDTNINIYITSRESGVGVKGADTSTGTQILYFWNPKIEKRRLSSTTGYLGADSTHTLSVPENTFHYIPVWSAGTNMITYRKDDLSLRRITPTALIDFQTDTAIEYIRIPISDKDGFPTSFQVQDNNGSNREVNIERDDFYNKYAPMLISYVNKKGAIEGIWFIRRSDTQMMTKSQTYYKNVIDYDTMEYDRTAHTYQKYNVSGVKAVTLNTSNIPQSMNAMFEEMKMSEQVWLSDPSGTFPVNMEDSSFRFKTHVNDKLVQYTMRFVYANRIDNTLI